MNGRVSSVDLLWLHRADERRGEEEAERGGGIMIELNGVGGGR